MHLRLSVHITRISVKSEPRDGLGLGPMARTSQLHHLWSNWWILSVFFYLFKADLPKYFFSNLQVRAKLIFYSIIAFTMPCRYPKFKFCIFEDINVQNLTSEIFPNNLSQNNIFGVYIAVLRHSFVKCCVSSYDDTYALSAFHFGYGKYVL